MNGKATKAAGRQYAAWAATLAMVLGLSGCYWDEEKAADDTSSGPGSQPPPSTPPANRAPTISGTPVTTAKVSLAYAFQPTARDPDGDRLTFEVRSKPNWATFDPATGRLSGTPPEGSSGTFTGVQIVVSDGKATSSLPAFSIQVLEPVVASVELAWTPPTANEDGSPLTDLSGYVIRFGRSAGSLDQRIAINNAGLSAYVIADLVEGTWYFSLSSVNSSGAESLPTGYVSKTIG